MPSLFRWETPELLAPVQAALTLEERRKVRSVPGAVVDEDTGEVTGAKHALDTVAHIFGPGAGEKTRTVKGVKFEKLSPYQNVGVALLSRDFAAGALCHDDLGLGKTPQCIAALAGLPIVKLVLCPAFLRGQWAAEIRRWSKLWRGKEEIVHVVKPASLVRRKDEPLFPAAGSWVIAYYAEAQRAIDALNAHHAQSYVLVVDEAHNLRSFGAQRTREVKDAAIWASGRIALTGDVLVNDVVKLYPVVDIVQPGAFGSYVDFIKRYAGATHNDFAWVPGKPTYEDELRGRLRYFAFRRTWDDIPAAERPFDTQFQTVQVPVKAGHHALRSLLTKGIQSVVYCHALAEAKFEAVCEAIASDVTAGLPSVTFTFTRRQAEELARRNKGLCVSGEIDGTVRLERINAYVTECRLRKKVPQIFSTYGAIGEGANLQWAKVVNFAALPFGSDVVRQGLARAARRGNTGTVTARFFVARGTADEHFVALMKKKLKAQMTLVGKQETAKMNLINALDFSEAEIKGVMQRMLDDARRDEGL